MKTIKTFGLSILLLLPVAFVFIWFTFNQGFACAFGGKDFLCTFMVPASLVADLLAAVAAVALANQIASPGPRKTLALAIYLVLILIVPVSFGAYPNIHAGIAEKQARDPATCDSFQGVQREVCLTHVASLNGVGANCHSLTDAYPSGYHGSNPDPVVTIINERESCYQSAAFSKKNKYLNTNWGEYSGHYNSVQCSQEPRIEAKQYCYFRLGECESIADRGVAQDCLDYQDYYYNKRAALVRLNYLMSSLNLNGHIDEGWNDHATTTITAHFVGDPGSIADPIRTKKIYTLSYDDPDSHGYESVNKNLESYFQKFEAANNLDLVFVGAETICYSGRERPGQSYLWCADVLPTNQRI